MGDAAAMNHGMRAAQPAQYSRNHFSTSPPFRSDVFRQGGSSAYPTSPTAERHPSDRAGGIPPLSATMSDPATFGQDARPAPAILIRKLSKHTSRETLASMLIFARDLIDTEFVRSPYPDDQGFATAVARFQSQAGAVEAQQKLHGKSSTTKEANMVVELQSGGMAGPYERRNTIDASSRTQTSSASSAGSLSGPPGRSRFGSTFQSSDQVSPPLPTSSSGGSAEFPVPDSSTHFQTLFSPQSPLANGVDARNGKYTINNDAVDDETGELLKDPIAYAQSGQSPLTRRPTNPQLPVGRFASLSLSTPTNGAPNGGMSSPPPTNLTSPRTATSMQSPLSPTNGTFPGYSNSQGRPPQHYPPANPADQNPPCNTLYVGNLPLSTSEDELKTLFSKQRGYKRLCFRTKQNGPMCFVEFEDVSFATKALNELYGCLLSNSVKGGIRLSFSKNPLGVRSGQQALGMPVNGMMLGGGGMGPGGAVMNPHVMAPGYGAAAGGGAFSAVSGPPPGLGQAPSMMSASNYRGPPPSQQPQALANGNMDASIFANPFGMPAHDFSGQIGSRVMAGAPYSPGAVNGGAYAKEGMRGGGWGDYGVGR